MTSKKVFASVIAAFFITACGGSPPHEYWQPVWLYKGCIGGCVYKSFSNEYPDEASCNADPAIKNPVGMPYNVYATCLHSIPK